MPPEHPGPRDGVRSRARTRARPWRAVLTAALLTLPATARQGPAPLAPDGHPGLGANTDPSELMRRLRTARDEERAFLGALHELGSDLRLALASLAESYRNQGDFDLLEAGEPRDLATLHASWRALLAHPLEALRAPGPRARAAARLLLDVRFGVRAEWVDAFELEERELERGLAVLEGAATSFVVLSREEFSLIARRVDLAASRLRALRNDLEALRPMTSARADASAAVQVDALLSAARESDPERARRAVADRVAQAQGRRDAMRSALFSARLESEQRDALAWRARALEAAAELARAARTYLPEGEEGRQAPREIQALRKHERVRLSGMRAREGLAYDPLDPELAYLAAHAADFEWGSLESRPLYDRFLFLVGIRHFDARTLKGRTLTPREREALDVVQRPPEGDPRGVGRDG